MSQFDLLINKKLKLWMLSKIEGSVLKYRVHTLWHTYIGERRTTFGKTYGIKVRCYEEHAGEHIRNLGNILATHSEFECNLVGTHWEARKNGKHSSPPSPPPTPQNFKGKKARHLECMLGPSHWLHEISLPKRVRHRFQPALISLAKNTLPIK